MKLQTTKAWILKVGRAKENIVEALVYTEQFGKLCLNIGGIEKAGSKRLSGCDILKEVELTLTLAEGSFYGRLLSVRELVSFERISQDIYRFLAASGLSEMLDVLTPFALPGKPKYDLFGRCMGWVGSEDYYQAVQLYFILRFLKLSGHGLHMNGCVSCGAMPEDRQHLTSGGVMCFKCVRKESYNIALEGNDKKSIINFLAHEPEKIIESQVSYNADRLKKLAVFLVRFHASRPLKTHVFERKLEEIKI